MDTIVNSVVGLTRNDLIVYGIISFLVVLWYRYKLNHRQYERLAAKLRGLSTYPIIGSALYFVGTSQQIMEKIINLGEDYGPDPYQLTLGQNFGVAITRPEDLQILLNSSKALDKGKYYTFGRKAFGDGLFSASVEKWKRHRQIISPVFNVNLLEHFLPIFIQKYQILIKILEKKVGEKEPFDLWDYIANANLDIICKTAMGYELNTQSNAESEFAKA